MKKIIIIFYICFVVLFLNVFNINAEESSRIREKEYFFENLNYFSKTKIENYVRKNIDFLTEDEIELIISNLMKKIEIDKYIEELKFNNIEIKNTKNSGLIATPKGINNVIKEFKIKNYDFFENGALKSEYNQNGTCGYVATSLLLAFYEKNMNPKYKKKGHLIQKNIYYYNTDKNEHIYASGGHGIDENSQGFEIPSIHLHNYLYYNVGMDKLGKANWLTQKGMKDLINWQITYQTSFYYDMWAYSETRGNVLKQLHKGVPVLITYLEYDYYIPSYNQYYRSRGLSSAHDVVIYGYRETEAGFYYLVHFGWYGKEYSKVMMCGSGLSRLGFAYIYNKYNDVLE